MRFAIEAGFLDLRLDGRDAVWALRRRLQVPVSHVTAATVTQRRRLPWAGLRMGGTSFPGRIQAGRYWRPAFGWSFWFVRKAEEVLLVELHDERFQRVVLEVDDPWRRADEISAALSGAVQ